MIHNQYVKEFSKSDIDINFFVELGTQWITQDWIDASAPLALRYTDENVLQVKDYKYLQDIRDKHPKLKDFIKLMKFEPGQLPAHIDTQRDCTFNIPVYNCNEGTLTRFFKNYITVKEKYLESFGAHGPKVWYSNEYITYIDGGEVDFEYSLTSPVLMDTHTPHDIINNTNDYRLIWSWTYEGTFKEALEDFENGI